jgi:alpha-galactosidase/6-phospho-beta-glucosidase family protein
MFVSNGASNNFKYLRLIEVPSYLEREGAIPLITPHLPEDGVPVHTRHRLSISMPAKKDAIKPSKKM